MSKISQALFLIIHSGGLMMGGPTQKEKDNYGYLPTQCICCGETVKPDEWSAQVQGVCIDCG